MSPQRVYKGFSRFFQSSGIWELAQKNVWQLFWGCDGWLPLAIAQKWLRNVPWHVEYYGAIDRTKPGPFGTLWNPELYELFLRGPIVQGDRSLKSWNSKVSTVVFSWSSSSACARSPPVPHRWPYSRRLPGRMVTRPEIFLSCDLGKRSVLLVKSCILPRHDVYICTERYRHRFEVWVCITFRLLWHHELPIRFPCHTRNRNVGSLGTLRHVCGHCSRWHHHGLCYRLLPVSSGQVCTHWSLCLSSRLGIRSWSADGGQVLELDVPFKRSRDVKRVESKARTSSMSFPLFSFAAWRNFPALGHCLVSQKFWLN